VFWFNLNAKELKQAVRRVADSGRKSENTGNCGALEKITGGNSEQSVQPAFPESFEKLRFYRKLA